MKRGFTFVILLLLVLLPISSVSAQKVRTINRTQKIQKTPDSSPEFRFGATQAFSEGNGVYLKWQTANENKTVGFLVYRLNGKGKELASRTIVPASYLQTRQANNEGNSYDFYDEKGDLNSEYIIESYTDNGKIVASAPFSTKQISNLKTVAESSNADFVRALQNDTPMLETNSAKLPKALNARKMAADSLGDLNNHRAIVAMPGVKIGVKKDGFYRVSRAELQAAGFDVNAAPNQWQLFLEGVELAINVGGNGDYIEFVGKGIDEIESDTRVYNLIVGAGNGKRMTSEIARPQGNGVPVSSFFQSSIRKERIVYANGILNGDEQNYFGTAIVASGGTVNFNLEDVDFEAGKSAMEIKIQGLTLTSHQIQVVLNGEPLDQISGYGRESMTGIYRIPVEYFREGNNTLLFNEITGSVSLVDTIKVDYYRKYRARNNQLSFYTQPNRPSTVNGFTSPNIRVFNLTNPLEPILITNLEVVADDTNFGIALLPGQQRNMIAVEDSGVLQAASITQNVPSTLSTPSHDADLVIISHGNFLAESEVWANYRRAQGFDVTVVNVEDIYDEFGFCVSSSNAIRGFLQYASTTWQTPPQYVLIVGDSSYDGRNYQGMGYFNYVPSKFVDTIYTEVPSDEALADFDDDGLSELAIGRIPARTPQAVTDAFNKTVNFELTAPQGFNRGAIFASDLPNGYDFEGLSQRLADQLPPSMTKVMINRALPTPQTTLINELNNGRFIANYSGHGNLAEWATSSFFAKANVAQLTNSDNLTLFVMLTCLNGYFTQPAPAGDGLSERLLSSTNGGGVAVWSSTGLTTPDIQEVMATRFYNRLTAGTIPRLGDLIKDSKGTIVGGRDVRLSWALLGDPMLKVR